jgi:hypothetical protein
MTDDEPVKCCPACDEIVVIGEDPWGTFPMTTDRVAHRCAKPQCPNNTREKKRT